MAEPPRILDLGLSKPLSIRDRLRGERMSAALQESPCPHARRRVVFRPWRRRSEQRSEPLSLKAKPKAPSAATNFKATEPS
jgi:hypothetical protein